jgi:1-acyl-sn-glycerol-3-phosphate acyltransferase
VTLLYRTAQIFSFLYFRFFHRFEVLGIENIPSNGSFILASNHQSYFDPPALGCCLPRNLHYFARDSLFRGPFGWLISNLNSIPVNRSQLDLGTFKRVLKILKSGHPILVFPEGTRSSNGEIGIGKKGVGLLIAKSSVSVVPSRVIGGFEILGKGKIFPRLGQKLIIKYGRPIEMSELDPGFEAENRYEVIAERILSAISDL